MTLLASPALGRRGATRLDVAILLTLAAIAIQLVPLTSSIREALTPAAGAFERRAVVGGATVAGAQPISLEPTATALALVLDTALALVFWSTQRALGHGGQRSLARAVSMLGLVVTPLAVANHLALLPPLDGMWAPARRDLRAWGPFVNRNDFAAWLALAMLLTLGYFVAHIEAHHAPGETLDPDRTFDRTGTRLAVALCVMSGGLMLSLSRSGLVGVAVGVAVLGIAGRRQLAPQRRYALAGIAVALLAVGAVFANAGALSARFGNAVDEGLASRFVVWRQTWPMAQDFSLTGTGIGAYARVMTQYQTSTRLITIVHADNEPLQAAAEGGLLVGLPLLLMLVSFVALAARRLREDRTRMFWMRVGAVSGLAAIAVQNLFEMTLRVPAIGLLVVVLAAIAVHERT